MCIRDRVPTNLSDQTIVFFDSSCNLCHSFVTFLSDKRFTEKPQFLAFNAQETKAYPEITTQLNSNLSVVVKKNNQTVTGGPALKTIARAVSCKSSLWQIIWSIVVRILDSVPDFLLTSLYKHIAKHRHQIFGQRKPEF